MTELAQAIEEMRNMRESYDLLVQGVITAPIVSELEDGKAAIIAAINAMGGTATESMSMGELADAILALILVQLGELEFDRPITSAQEAANMLQNHCTKYVDDFTEIMETPLIVDEWQAVEEVRYKKLLDYNYTQFSSDERKSGIYCLTNCHNLRKLTFDSLRTIDIPDATSQFVAGNLIRLEEIIAPALISITSSFTSNTVNAKVFEGLSSLTSLSLPSLKDISLSIGGSNVNNASIFTNLTSLTSLSLPSLIKISGNGSSSQTFKAFTNLTSLTSLSLPALTTISAPANYQNSCRIFTNLTSLTSLSLPAIKTIIGRKTGYGEAAIFSGCVNLEYIEIGHIHEGGGSIIDNMFISINPTNIYDDEDKLAALNASIRDHWFANLYDYTGGTAHTITLPTAFVQHMEQATKDVAAAKNWTIVTF